jgi:DNA repair ATPase RecN
MSADQSTKKISDVEVRNYMRVRRARLTLDGNTFVISGDNEQGKSSFVQAIEDAFGGSKFSPAMPIRKGATEAVILITLTDGSGRVLKAEIVHSKTGRRLVVKDGDGTTQASPQAIMDAFWAETSFDPSLFLISKPDKQVEMLKLLGGLDFAALDKERAEKFMLRTSVKKEADRLATLAVAMPGFPAAPKEEASAQSILDEITKANTHNATRAPLVEAEADFRKSIEDYVEETRSIQADITEIDEEIKRLQAKRSSKTARLTEVQTAIGKEKTAHEAARKTLDSFQTIDVAPLQAQLAGIETTNQQVRANKSKSDAQKRARDKQDEADKLTTRIEEIDEAKREKLANAKFPIEGMSITDAEVTINGIPLAQQSDMRRLAIGVEMAAAMNPGKPLMLVRHGNLFTPENFHVLEEIAAKRNLTCIVEIAGKNVAGAKLVFEDGVGVELGAGAQTELPTA